MVFPCKTVILPKSVEHWATWSACSGIVENTHSMHVVAKDESGQILFAVRNPN